jgi:polyketide cyclase/dehydrase/lipid transport protein
VAKIFTSSVINAPMEEVWAKIRDFNALPGWHPAVADSHIENGGPSDRVGCIRNFNLKDGGNIREQLLTLSDVEHTSELTQPF